MSQFISRESAREIDRLARAAHRFHRYAHHPLCARYAGEVIAVGRKARICKGCALSVLGGALGAGSTAWLRPSAGLCIAAIVIAGALWLISTRSRAPKELSRGVPAFLLGLGMGSFPSIGIGAAIATGFFFIYRWRGPDRSPCTSCPERARPICSGYLRIARRERAFARFAAARIPYTASVWNPGDRR